MDNFVQDMADGEGDDDEDLGEPALEDPEDVEFFEEFISRINNDDFLFGSLRKKF